MIDELDDDDDDDLDLDDDLDDLDDDDDDDLSDLDDDDDDDDLDDDEPKEYSPEVVERAKSVKIMRLFIEDKGRRPHTASELSFFAMSSDVDHPVEPEEEDLEKAAQEIEAEKNQ